MANPDTDARQRPEDVQQDTEGRTEQDPKVDEEMRRLEQDPPQKLEDWPSGKAKYRTLGGGEHEEGYGEGGTASLGPHGVRHHEDGSVTVQGENVENPDEYKGDPIPGGPTDPDAPPDIGVTRSMEDRIHKGDEGERREGDARSGDAGTDRDEGGRFRGDEA